MTSSKLPEGKLARGAVVGSAAISVGAKRVAAVGMRPFLSDAQKEELNCRQHEEAAKTIFGAICKLRGTALKAAQLFAVDADLLPEEYRREFSKACSQVPPMNRALLRKAVSSELGNPAQRFTAFEWHPFAAASLGQVHLARLENQQRVAVKIQYPGLARSVASDVALAKGFLAPTKWGRIFEGSFDVIQKKVEEELDYQREAHHTERFRSMLDPKRFKVPRVFAEHSTRAVLTTEFIEGLHVDKWLDTKPSQALRNHFGQLLADLFNECFFVHHRFHSDPNPGNYLFCDDGRLGVIDFGCVETISPFVCETMKTIWTLDGMPAHFEIEQFHNRLGVRYNKKTGANPALFEQFLQKWFLWIRAPFHPDGFDFSTADSYFEESAEVGQGLFKYVDRIDGSFLYFGRALEGLLQLLRKIGAKVRMNPFGAA